MTTTRTYTTIDKSGWGEGPWQDEPDKVQWTDKETGLPCLAKRIPHSGHWCGYVGVSEGHPMFEMPYDDVRFPRNDDEDGWPNVHGGLTYADHCQEGPEDATICHVPEPGQPDHVWWLGFDCAHSGDFSPAYRVRMAELAKENPIFGESPYDRQETYKTLGYVQDECASLAAELAAVAAS